MVSVAGLGRKWRGPIYRAPEMGGGGGGGGVPPRQINVPKMTVYDLAGTLRGKTVLVRCDYNVTKVRKVEGKDDYEATIPSWKRVEASLETLQFLLREGVGRIVIISHNGRPKDLIKELQKKKDREKARAEALKLLSLEPVAAQLAKLLSTEVKFVGQEIYPGYFRLVSSANKSGRVFLLENTRGNDGDEKGDPVYASQIASYLYPDIFVLDGFSVAHRDQASVTGVARVVRSLRGQVVAGQLLAREIDYLQQKILANPAHPLVIILGGAKVSGKEGKLKMIQALLAKLQPERGDRLIIGGALAYPFLLADSYDAGSDPIAEIRKADEPLEADKTEAAGLLANYRDRILLPSTLIGEDGSQVDLEELGTERSIGRAFVMRDVLIQPVLDQLAAPQTLVWNGDLGKHRDNTLQMLRWARGQTQAVRIAGGGDSEMTLQIAEEKHALKDVFEHVSTGGGAMVELLEKGSLVGFDVLDDYKG